MIQDHGPEPHKLQLAPLREALGEHQPGYRLRRGRNWLFLGLLYAGYYMCRYNLSTVTPEIANEFHFNNKQTGWISTGRDLGYAIGTFTNGLFTDALGGKQSMLIGAIGTIIMNIAFGLFSKWNVAFLLTGFFVIRTLDGYLQSFGSPGMVKINASWFQRRERGSFAGVFGLMIQLGQFVVNWLSAVLLTGAVAFGAWTLFTFQKLDWRMMFFVPTGIIAVLALLMWLNVKNHPEEAGYSIAHEDDEHASNPQQSLPLREVRTAILSNPLAWINAGAYMCTGFVRRAYDFWWAKYMFEQWKVGKDHPYFAWLGFWLVAAAVLGSMTAGFVSDRFFKSRRSPVGAVLYGIESLVILVTLIVLGFTNLGSPLLACILLTLISFTCNSSHSIIGTAAVMDIGGRKMSGFALGFINSFQYWGSILAGFALGALVDRYKWVALFAAMLPFSVMGMILMTVTAIKTRGRQVKGA